MYEVFGDYRFLIFLVCLDSSLSFFSFSFKAVRLRNSRAFSSVAHGRQMTSSARLGSIRSERSMAN